MSEEKKPFTVTDRRHFTAEGEARAKEAPPAAEEPPAPSKPAGRPAEPGIPGMSEPGDEAADFGTLLLSLGAQAGMLLHDDGETKADLRGARAIISMLEVLRDKTEGRRTPEEERILESLLYELRLAYVTRSKAPGA
ncbi:MAG TPA: DUF1844 domain-containing protein [Vicinamibacteria bacterium]|nr:DUF1844 domain-containing protein [Vicinamibacteria bacterium]